MKDLIGDYESFLSDLIKNLEVFGIEIRRYWIDHLGYRVATSKEYEQKKSELIRVSSSYIENIFHERRIAKFILKKPIEFNGFTINLVELPSPKKDKVYETGLEHAEIVVGDDFEKLKNSYKWERIDDAGTPNETLCINFRDKTAKFHRLSLKEVIEKDGGKFVSLNS